MSNPASLRSGGLRTHSVDVSVEVGAMLVESMLMGAETSSAIPTLLTLASATAQLLDHIFCSLETTWLILLTCNRLATINILKKYFIS